MIHLFHQGKFHDSFFNTLNDAHFMEVSMINLGFDPAECEWVEMEANFNGHNPKKINDSEKSCEWILGEVVPTAIVTNPDEIPTLAKTYYSAQVFRMLTRVIAKQNEVLEKYLLPTTELPPIPDKFIAQTVVENKIVHNQMKKMIPADSDYVFKAGKRLKHYSSEDPKTVLPKYDSLKNMAIYLLSTKAKWRKEPGPNGEKSFYDKLMELKGL